MDMRIIYRGVRLQPDEGTTSSVQVDVLHQIQAGTQSLVSHELAHFVHHSPDGFNWGYQGSGPSELALAILLDHLKEAPTREQMSMGQPLAWRLHQFFKRDFVAGWGDTWQISSEDVDEWLATDQIKRHVKEHADLWRDLNEIVSDPLPNKWHEAPTVEWKENDNAGK